MIGVLNDGYRRGGRVYRMGGNDNSTLLSFLVYCPKVLVGLKELPTDALRSRCLRVELKSRKPTEPGDGFLYEDEEPKGRALRDRLDAQFGDVSDEATGKRPARIDGVSDRTWECVRPLVILADLAGVDWPRLVRDAITSVAARSADVALSSGVRLLVDCQRVFNNRATQEISKQQLLDELTALEEAPYGDWEKFTTNRLTRTLKKYGIPAGTFVHDEFGRSHRGWRHLDFEDAWERWLPASEHDERANRANGLVKPELAEPEACEETSPHGSDQLENTHDDASRTLRTLPSPDPAANGFRDLLNLEHVAGRLSDRHRQQHRLAHDRALHVQPAAGEQQLLAEINELIDEGVLAERDGRA